MSVRTTLSLTGAAILALIGVLLVLSAAANLYNIDITPEQRPWLGAWAILGLLLLLAAARLSRSARGVGKRPPPGAP
jgi:divalent metal cation (Fe/Co/Zn/Cd) transporter